MFVFFLSRHLMVSITEMIRKSYYRRLSFIFRRLCHQGWIGNTKYFMMECDRVMVKVKLGRNGASRWPRDKVARRRRAKAFLSDLSYGDEIRYLIHTDTHAQGGRVECSHRNKASLHCFTFTNKTSQGFFIPAQLLFSHRL